MAPPKLEIVSIDSPNIKAIAQFNPKEMAIDKSVPWNKHKNPKGDIPMLEFTNAENRNMTFELFFDTVEQGTPVSAQIEPLHQMTLIRQGVSAEKDKHPPRVMVVWPGVQPPFKGVIESLAVKYTMFSDKGFPVRATATLKIKEVDEVQAGGGEGGGGGGAGGGGGGGSGA
jgi:hypothetical protein